MSNFKNYLKLTCLFIGLITGKGYGQKAEAPDASYDIGGKINEMILTEVGTLVVASNDGLIGIKPESKELVFKFTDYGRVKPEELQFSQGTPYLVVGQTGFGGISTKKAVINYLSGDKLFSTEQNGWKNVGICEVIMPQNKLVVSGQRRAKEKYAQAVALYDLDTGKQISFFKFKGSEIPKGTPLLLKDGVVVPTTKSLLKINMDSGNIDWKADLKNVNWMVANDSEEDIYAFVGASGGKNTKIHKISAQGKIQWQDPHKVKGSVVNFEIIPEGIAVVSNVNNSGKKGLMKLASGRSESKIAFLSADSGADLWEKAPKTKGFVQHFYMMDDGILFGVYEGGINKISFDGQTLFKKPLKTGENILTMARTDNGLIYITSEDANIVDLKTGNQVWKKPLKYKRADYVSSAYDAKNDRFLISADEKLYTIDANSGTAEVIAETKMEGKEDPSKVEIRDGGILRTSSQNMTLLNWDGGEKWHEYRRAPGKSAFGAVLAGALMVASATASVASAAKAQQHRNRLGHYTREGVRHKAMAENMANAAGMAMQEMLKKFKATSATQDAQFVLTKWDAGIGLVKLNKDTGAQEKEILLKNKKPEYQVDEYHGVLYYKANNSTIYMYDLK